MPKCIKKQRRKRSICIGDLNSEIEIETRAIKAPSNGGFSFNEQFTTTQTVYALIETKSGLQVFDGVNTISTPSHMFYIRYIENVTFENYIIYKGDRYDVLDVENLEERDEFYLLRCSKMGKKDIKTTYSR